MKILMKDHLTLKGQVKNSIYEQKILKQFTGKPYINQLKFSFQTENKLFIVTDYYENGEMFYHLKKLKYFDTEVLKFYLPQVV